MESSSDTKISKNRKSKNDYNLYNKIIISKKISIPMLNIGANLKNNLQKIIENSITGKCINEGFIKPNSIEIISYSNGLLQQNNIVFQVVFQCLSCNPVEGQSIICKAKNITKAGIRAEVDDENNPLVIFIARDHNYLNKFFSTVKENQEITVRVIGQRFELNDKNISIIANLVDTKSKGKSPKLSIDKDDEVDIDVATIE